MGLVSQVKEFIKEVKRQGLGPYSIQERDIDINPLDLNQWSDDYVKLEIFCYKLVSPQMILEFHQFVDDVLSKKFPNAVIDSNMNFEFTIKHAMPSNN